MAAFALKYRLPREEGSVYNMSHPRQDGLRAMRLVRSRASEWGIDPARIGMVGFSARRRSGVHDRVQRQCGRYERPRPH